MRDIENGAEDQIKKDINALFCRLKKSNENERDRDKYESNIRLSVLEFLTDKIRVVQSIDERKKILEAYAYEIVANAHTIHTIENKGHTVVIENNTSKNIMEDIARCKSKLSEINNKLRYVNDKTKNIKVYKQINLIRTLVGEKELDIHEQHMTDQRIPEEMPDQQHMVNPEMLANRLVQRISRMRCCLDQYQTNKWPDLQSVGSR